LELSGVGKSFGGIAALSEVSFGVPGGSVTGLIGPNGAGKTTLFNLVTGLLRPTAGRIRFLGEEIAGLEPHDIARRGIARTFQNIRLFAGMTAVENVMVGAHARCAAGVLGSVARTRAQRAEERRVGERALELLALVGLAEAAQRLPEELPYGHQRRLEIARALAAEPRLLLLDEPAAGMNEGETREIAALVAALRAKGLTILLIDHDMSLVMEACDRIAVLNFGRLIALGSPGAVRRDPAVIEAYLGREGGRDDA